MNVIELQNLHKQYGSTVAVDNISFNVQRGEIFCIVGPNGAGKSTTVESIMGLRQPDSGTIRVLGLDPQKDGQARKHATPLGMPSATFVTRAKRLF